MGWRCHAVNVVFSRTIWIGPVLTCLSAGVERNPGKAAGISVAPSEFDLCKQTLGRFQPMTPELDRPTDEVLRRVQGEFLEMPGLRLTGAQARRLWGLDAGVCEALLGLLVDAN